MAIRERVQRTAGAPSDEAAERPRRLPRLWRLALGALTMAGLYAGAASTTVGRVTYTYVFYFMHFYAGVFILMGLTGTVLFGVVATDRMVLNPRMRVWMQVIHRGLAIFSVAFIGVHVWTKTTAGSITLLNAVVPFTSPGPSLDLYLGAGPLSAYLMLSVFWTGIARLLFADKWSPWVWRILHSGAYLAWPLALLHGLGAGRRAATWVIFSYLLCVLLVAVALVLRLATSGKRQRSNGRVARPTLAIDAEGRQVRTVEVAGGKGRAASRERVTNPLEERWATAAESWAAHSPALVTEERAALPDAAADDEDDEDRLDDADAGFADEPADEADWDGADDEDDEDEADWFDDPRELAEVRDYQPRRLREYQPRRARDEARADRRRSRRDAEPRVPRFALAAGDERELEFDFDGERWDDDDIPTLVDLSARRARRRPAREEQPRYAAGWREAQ